MSLNQKPSKPTPSHPDVCGKCQGAHGPAKYRVRVNIYLLEDLPIAAYYFELCEHCMMLQSRQAKRQRIITRPCSHEAV